MINLQNNCSEQQFIKLAKNDPQFSKVEINGSTRQFLNSCPEQKLQIWREFAKKNVERDNLQKKSCPW